MRFAWCVFFLLVSAQLRAEPKFAEIFSDNAVLQRDSEICIWGFGAEEDSSLVVALGSEEMPVLVGKDGDWQVYFPRPFAESRKGIALQLFDHGKLVDEARDILFGDVWLAAGQSNMQMTVRSMVKGLPSCATWAESAQYPKIRIRRIGDPVRQDDERTKSTDLKEGQWLPMAPDSVSDCSAVAAVFAREVFEKTNTPIGIIDVSWGGKPIEPFIPRADFTSPLMMEIRRLADAGKIEDLAKMEGGVVIRNPEGHPGAIFRSRMAPLTRFQIKGFLWYQGESNAGKGEDPTGYREKMEVLVRGWRREWGEQGLPFYFVQLPSYKPASGWIRMREEQRLAAESIPKCEMVVTIDLPGADIHPPHKIEVGKRLASLALQDFYQQKSEYSSGPRFREAAFEDGKAIVSFVDAGDGLRVGSYEGGLDSKETNPNWFELSDHRGVWYDAAAIINGAQVIVSSDQVREPVAVRYGCRTEMIEGLLYGSEGLPVSPFCSRLSFLPWAEWNLSE